MTELYSTLLDSPSKAVRLQKARAYLALMKPRVMSLAVFTALVGMVAAPSLLSPMQAIIAIAAISLGAGASGALNMWWDRDIDAIMTRTRNRPLPQGLLKPNEALVFGLALACVGVVALALSTNVIAGALLAFSIFFYIVVYTVWLKRRTPQNIVIGGAAGALPPVIGWACQTGGVSLESLILFLQIFLWTPPHFWALALVRAQDYAAANIPMAPIAKGVAYTRRAIFAYSVALWPAVAAPVFWGAEGVLYGVATGISGGALIALTWLLLRENDEKTMKRRAMRVFGYSIFHLFFVFAFILVEHGFTRIGLW